MSTVEDATPDNQNGDIAVDFDSLPSINMGRDVAGDIRAKQHDGRELKVSICDLIDNSIDGQANNIDIRYLQTEFLGKDKMAMIVLDDGHGIPADNMHNCLMFNSIRIEGNEHEEWMLGSFGAGLKDACLAHGRELTLLSKVKGAEASVWRLSLSANEYYHEESKSKNEMSDWKLIANLQDYSLEETSPGWVTDAYKSALFSINRIEEGTILLLEDMEIPTGGSEVISAQHEIMRFIEMTFCDYLEGIDIGPRKKEEPLKIVYNGQHLKPLDPFFRKFIGHGPNSGHEGTLRDIYEPEEDGIEFEIERYIIPKANNRNAWDSDNDNHLKTATKLQINDLQGIYFKRNGRMLDGPWNGKKWRRSKMSMGDSHHTIARWCFVLSPNSIRDKDLIPPDKGSVRSDKFNEYILEARNKIVVWHSEDEEDYSNVKGKLSGGVAYHTRVEARSRTYDRIFRCTEEGCDVRVSAENLACEDHQRERCGNPNCQETMDGEGQYCELCEPRVCEDCGILKEHEGAVCVPCNLEDCEAPGCGNKRDTQGPYCLEHASMVCFVSGCQNLAEEGFSSCSNHRRVPISGTDLEFSIERRGDDGPEMELREDGLIAVNLDKEVGLSRLIMALRRQKGDF